jgi:transcriptional regulator with XRE-family HTH domain
MADGTPIGTRIQRRRQALGMKQEDLARRVGVSKSSVANWEVGRHFPQRYQGALEAVLGISLDDKDADPLLVPQDDHEQFILSMDDLPRERKREMIASYRRATASGAGPFPSAPATAGDDRRDRPAS